MPDRKRTTGRWSPRHVPETVSASRRGLIAVCSLLALASAIWLFLGIGPTAVAVLAFLATCLFVAMIVVLLPKEIRARYGLLATAFVAAAGLLAAFANPREGGDGEAKSPPEPSASPNIDYAAELLARGPFTGDVGEPLTFVSLHEESVDLPNAVAQVALEFDGGEAAHVALAYLWLYRSAEDAEAASAERFETLSKQYAEFGYPHGDSQYYSVFSNGGIDAGGFSGPVYCEGIVAPDSNYHLTVAAELVSSCLRYGDDMVGLATR